MISQIFFLPLDGAPISWFSREMDKPKAVMEQDQDAVGPCMRSWTSLSGEWVPREA